MSHFAERAARYAACLLLVLAVTGCGSKPSGEATKTGGESSANDSVSTEDSGEFVLGDLVEPFETPATLEELDEGVEWVDSPVVDSLELLREQKKSEPALVSVEEALSIKNDSAEANQKILSALSVLAPKDGSGVKYGAVLNRAIQQDLRSLNPILSSSMSESEISSLTAFGLFSFDWNFTPFASSDVVVSWQTSKDRMYDKVVIRDDLVWSDGEPITAYDVEFSFKVIMSSKVPVPAQRQGTDQLKAVKAYDDHTLVYFQEKPLATNVWNLNFAIIPKHIYGESIADDPTLRTSDYHIQQEKSPVYGGPYEIEKRERGSSIVLKRRESWYMHGGKQVREKPYFAKVRHRVIEDPNTQLLALKSADVDEALIGAEQWLTQTDGESFYRNNTKVRGSEWTFFFIAWNLKSPLFEDLEVRKALAHVMNYDEMIEDLCYGLYPRCHGIYHPDAWMFPEDPAPLYQQDLDTAEDLLDAAGWEDSDGDGTRDKEINGRLVPFEFSLVVSNKPDRIAICNLYRENLESIGIRCNIAPLEAAVLQERMQNKEFEASFSGWGAGADPYTNKNIFGTGEGRNYGSYSNDEVDRLLAEGETEFDREKRAKIYGAIHNQIYADQPYLFLYTRSSFYGFNKRLRGYRFSPRGPFSYGPGLGSVWVPADY